MHGIFSEWEILSESINSKIIQVLLWNFKKQILKLFMAFSLKLVRLAIVEILTLLLIVVIYSFMSYDGIWLNTKFRRKFSLIERTTRLSLSCLMSLSSWCLQLYRNEMVSNLLEWPIMERLLYKFGTDGVPCYFVDTIASYHAVCL